jgi:hypothetical protein
MSTNKDQRALVVVNELDLDPDTAVLYRGLETTGRFFVEQLGGNHYAHVRKLYDQDATADNLVNALQAAAGRPGIREVDLIIMLHGEPEVLVFARDDRVKSATLGDRIADLGIAAKLRLAYSTACFGASHADDLVAAGFTAAVGARKVNANGGIEVPVFTAEWPKNRTLSEVMATAQTGREAQDAAAEMVGGLTGAPWVGQVDSTKVIRGNGSIRITTSAG